MKNPTYVALLERAKRVLARTSYEYYSRPGRRRYICTAVDRAVDDVPGATPSDVAALQDLIMDRLGSNSTLEGWLREHAYLDDATLDELSPRQFAKVQRTRLAWIDSLIEEFS
jgi:hypothetical protein